MNFQNRPRIDTLAALQAYRLEQEKTVKDVYRTKASRLITRVSTEKDWPSEDLEEVLGALGLTP